MNFKKSFQAKIKVGILKYNWSSSGKIDAAHLFNMVLNIFES